jgi:hypothetical protein
MNQDKGLDNNVEMEENPFHKEEVENKLTREELMKKTGKELAQMAQPKSRFKIKTLERLPKAELCDIILDITVDEKPKARASRTESESDNIINFAIDTLEAIKKSRGANGINPIAKEIFKSSAVNKVDEARADGNLSSEKFNNTLLVLSGVAITIDSIIGFENVPTLFQRLKAKLSKSKKDDTK